MSEQQVDKPKRTSIWGRFKGFIAKIYIIVVTIALIHLVLSQNSESYREFADEFEQSVQDIQIDFPDILATVAALPTHPPAPTSNVPPTPAPLFFSSEEYGSDAFIPVVLLEPGRYRYSRTGEWMTRLTVCGVPRLFSEPRARFTLRESCDLELVVPDVGESPWSIMIEPEPDYKETGW